MDRTPGEWVAEMYSMPTGADDFDCGASVYAVDRITGHRKEVAFVKELEEQEANAKLMAAAPKMLEALKAIQYWSSDARIPCCFPRDLLNDAIASAEKSAEVS